MPTLPVRFRCQQPAHPQSSAWNRISVRHLVGLGEMLPVATPIEHRRLPLHGLSPPRSCPRLVLSFLRVTFGVTIQPPEMARLAVFQFHCSWRVLRAVGQLDCGLVNEAYATHSSVPTASTRPDRCGCSNCFCESSQQDGLVAHRDYCHSAPIRATKMSATRHRALPVALLGVRIGMFPGLTGKFADTRFE